MRVGIFGYGPSDSVQILRDGLLEAEHEGTRVLLSNGESRFRGRTDEIIINYGSSNQDNVRRVTHNATIINNAEAVGQASNKLSTYNILSATTSLPMLPTTSSVNVARQWLLDGDGVYARTVLTGHSGEGIVYVANERPEHLGNVEFSQTLPISAMYTKAIDGDRAEYRVHVAFGDVILIQQKRRRNGWRENEDYSDIVRNHGNGWIYATSNLRLPEQGRELCLRAIDRLGLDFGAVDIIVRNDLSILVEVNTAPGLQGESSRQAYVEAFSAAIDSHILRAGSSILNPETWVGEEMPNNVAPPAPQEMTVDLETTQVSDSSPSTFWQPVDWEQMEVDAAPITSEEAMAQVVESQEAVIRSNLESAMTEQGMDITEDAVRNRLDAIFGNNPTATRAEPEPGETPSTGRVRINMDDMVFNGGRGRTPSRQQREPEEARDNNLSSQAAPEPLVNTMELNGPGHYIADISGGVRTVICVLGSGEIYSAEHDLYLQAGDISVLSQINV